MSQPSKRVFYVVAAGAAPAANRVCEEAGFGAKAISAPLCAAGSPDGTAASHFWCSWAIRPEDEATVVTALAGIGLQEGAGLGRLVVDISEGEDPEATARASAAFLAGLGLQRCVKGLD